MFDFKELQLKRNEIINKEKLSTNNTVKRIKNDIKKNNNEYLHIGDDESNNMLSINLDMITDTINNLNFNLSNQIQYTSSELSKTLNDIIIKKNNNNLKLSLFGNTIITLLLLVISNAFLVYFTTIDFK